MNCTFLALLEKNTIEIPIIQRDYAQGRADKEHVRKGFVNAMMNALIDKKNIELDFIYGPTVNDVFSPLDGQQRLTTLFLLHWYLSVRSNKCEDNGDGDYKTTLAKFTYSVRVTIQEFLNALLDKSKGLKLFFSENGDIELCSTNSLADTIKDAPWYYSIWDYDPSIQGLINTLQTIHEIVTAKECTPASLWENLANSKYITFFLLKTDVHGLEDDIYMRMNARGIPLTPFENFKAWLQGYVSNFDHEELNCYWKTKDNAISARWLSCLDKDWTDLIWKYAGIAAEKQKKAKEEGGKEVGYTSSLRESLFDDYFLRLFKGIAQFGIAEQSKEKNTQENKELWIENLSAKDTLTSLDQYEDMSCFSGSILNDTFCMLQFIKNNKPELSDFYFEEKNKDNVFHKFISQQGYDDKIIFYALIQYLKVNRKDKENDWEIADPDHFKNYKRIVRNLIANSDINNATFVNITKSIKTLSEHSSDIYSYLSEQDMLTLTGISATQIKEEIRKAKIIKASEIESKWEKSFSDAEGHTLFEGNIDLLLLNGVQDIGLFRSKYQKFNLLWQGTGLAISTETEKNIVIKSLLSQKIPLEKGTNLANTRDAWKKNIEGKCDWKNTVNTLLTNLPETKAAVIPYLQRMINSDRTGSLSFNRRILIHTDILVKNPYLKKWNKEDNYSIVTPHKKSRGRNKCILNRNRDLSLIRVFNQLKKLEKNSWKKTGRIIIINNGKQDFIPKPLGDKTNTPKSFDEIDYINEYSFITTHEHLSVGIKITDHIYACLTINGGTWELGIKSLNEKSTPIELNEISFNEASFDKKKYEFNDANTWWFAIKYIRHNNTPDEVAAEIQRIANLCPVL